MPKIDPVTGKEIQDNNTPPNPDPNMVQIPKAEFDALKTRLDVFERSFVNNRPVAPTPPVQQGPTVAQQIGELEKQIAAFDAQIDDAVAKGQPVSRLIKERSALERKITRLQIKSEDIDPAMNVGIGVIDQLSDEITRGKMPHLSLVKDDYDRALQAIPPEQRMNPQMRQAAYNIAVGQNIDKITAAEREKILRENANPPNNAPPNSNGRNNANAATPGIPHPEDVLSKEALAAIKFKGMTVDQYYQKMGHKDGWRGFWEKSGKTYFGETNAD
jgi:hypothetical protein